MATKKSQKIPKAKTPTVVIYQNPDFVLGLLQETFKQGLLDYTETNSVVSDGKEVNTVGGADGKLGGGVKVPGIGEVKGNVGTDVSQTHSNNNEVTSTDHKKFVYSQAFFLDQMRTALHERGLITQVKGLKDFTQRGVGEFVEFDAYFAPNEVNVVLDILTPDLTAEITRYVRRRQGLKEVDQVVEQAEMANADIPVERINRMKALYEAKANDQAELAKAIARAVRQDFRGDTTKEFYATIGGDGDVVTAVAVCEAEYFVSKDSDRLLDGRFTVLAKVISDVRKEVPILERNKLLKRLNVEAVDSFLGTLRGSNDAAEYLDLEFRSTIEGSSVTVLPIAIYV